MLKNINGLLLTMLLVGLVKGNGLLFAFLNNKYWSQEVRSSHKIVTHFCLTHIDLIQYLLVR